MLASSVPTDSTSRAQHAVLRVEQHDAELLDRRGCRTAAAGARRAARASTICTRSRRGARQRSPPELDRGENLRGARVADPGNRAQLVVARAARPCSPPARRAPRWPGRARWRAARRGRARSRAARCRRAPPRRGAAAFHAADRAARRPSSYTIPCYTFVLMPRLSSCSARSRARRAHRRRAPNPPTKKSIGRSARSTPRAPPAPSSTRPRASPRRPRRCSKRTKRSTSATTAWRSRVPSTRSERAQEAAQPAADGKAKARSDAEVDRQHDERRGHGSSTRGEGRGSRARSARANWHRPRRHLEGCGGCAAKSTRAAGERETTRTRSQRCRDSTRKFVRKFRSWRRLRCGPRRPPGTNADPRRSIARARVATSDRAEADHGDDPQVRVALESCGSATGWNASQAASAISSAQPVRNRPSSVHSTRCAPPGETICDVARGAAELDRRDGRRARAGARRFGRADAALPDQDPHAVGRLDRRQLDVRAVGKMRMHGQLRRDRVQPVLLTSPRTTHCGLPTRSVTTSTGTPSTSIVVCATCSGCPIAARNV